MPPDPLNLPHLLTLSPTNLCVGGEKQPSTHCLHKVCRPFPYKRCPSLTMHLCIPAKQCGTRGKARYTVCACAKYSVLLGQAWASPTLAWLHLRKLCVCTCMYIWLRPYTVNFKWAHLNISWRPNILGYHACINLSHLRSLGFTPTLHSGCSPSPMRQRTGHIAC